MYENKWWRTVGNPGPIDLVFCLAVAQHQSFGPREEAAGIADWTTKASEDRQLPWTDVTGARRRSQSGPLSGSSSRQGERGAKRAQQLLSLFGTQVSTNQPRPTSFSLPSHRAQEPGRYEPYSTVPNRLSVRLRGARAHPLRSGHWL